MEMRNKMRRPIMTESLKRIYNAGDISLEQLIKFLKKKHILQNFKYITGMDYNEEKKEK